MNARSSFKKAADILKYFEDLFGAVTQQAWCFPALQQIACEKSGLARIFHKGRREMRERAGDAALRAGNCLQAYWRYVENNFQEKRRRFGTFTHCSRPLVKYPG